MVVRNPGLGITTRRSLVTDLRTIQIETVDNETRETSSKKFLLNKTCSEIEKDSPMFEIILRKAIIIEKASYFYGLCGIHSHKCLLVISMRLKGNFRNRKFLKSNK